MLKRVDGRAATYGDTITRARERQLRLTTRNVNRLMRTYNAAAESITQQISGLPAHMIGDANDAMRQVYLENILREIEATLTQFRTMFAGRLRGGMLELAQAAVDREARVQALGGTMRENDPLLARDMTEQVSLPNGNMASIEFGRVAHDAVEALATRYYGDGLRLSDRLYDVDRTFRRGVENTLMQAVVEGASIRETIDRLTAGPLSKTSDAAHRAAVIARTEIAHAYTEAHVRSVKDPTTGLWREGVTGLKWSLSVSHPKPDICDIWAMHDEGRGTGVYYSTPVPSDHPNGLCFTTTVLAAVPESAVWSGGQVPDLDGITDAHVQYYADRGDTVAQRYMMSGG